MSPYDAESPYFAGWRGQWSGWAKVLTCLLSGEVLGLDFVAASWQKLVPKRALDDVTRAWAEKHGR